jgi:chemotaxis protein CheX
MANIKDLDGSVFQLTITRAVQAVFKTMLGKSAKPVPTTADSPVNSVVLDRPHVVGTVGVVGTINGLIYLYFEDDFAQACAARLLRLTASEIEKASDETVNDAIGELTNMTVGTFKNQLAERGFPCRLTTPSILRGRQFSITPGKGATRHLFRFDIDGHSITADIQMQAGQ